MFILKINIASVLKNDGASQQFSSSVNLGEFDLMGSTLTFTQPVTVNGKILNIGGTLEISAQIEGEYTTQCSRCGESVAMTLSAELFESVENDFSYVDDECISITGNIIDITGSVNACIFNSIPLQFLCSEDCKGLCPVCGINLNNEECNCETEVYDPRFAIFRNLSKEV